MLLMMNCISGSLHVFYSSHKSGHKENERKEKETRQKEHLHVFLSAPASARRRKIAFAARLR
jgi:hypothetical protein